MPIAMKPMLGPIAAMLVFTACLTESTPLLFVNFETVPDSVTSQESVTIAGDVVRSPPNAQLEYWVAVTGGAAPVEVKTSEFLLFVVTVPLVVNAENRLEIVARDSEGTRSEAYELVVRQSGSVLAVGGP